MYFSADDGEHGEELWISDGTMDGTRLVKDVNTLATCDEWTGVPGWGSLPCSSEPTYLTELNGFVYFAATNGDIGRELWKSDGTDANTTLVKNINILETCNTQGEEPDSGTSPCSSDPTRLTRVNDLLFFAADDDGDSIAELWKSDGTAAGTIKMNDLNPNAPTNPRYLINVNGMLFFSGDETALWKTDGTGTNTKIVMEFSNRYVSRLVTAGDGLFCVTKNVK